MKKFKIKNLKLHKRLDIFARIIFLENISRCSDYAHRVYKEAIV